MTTKAKTVVCVGCKHYRHMVQNEAATEAWYNHKCAHPDVENMKCIDPVTGEEGWALKNDLGRTCIMTDDANRYPYCRDVNDGTCAMFEAPA